LSGDSSTEERKLRFAEFKAKMEKLSEGKEEFVFVLDDPAGNSYLQVLFYIKISKY